LPFEKEKGNITIKNVIYGLGCSNIVEIVDNMSLNIGIKNGRKSYKFDSCFDEKAS